MYQCIRFPSLCRRSNVFLQDQSLSLKYRQLKQFLTFHPQQRKVLSDNVKISGVHVEQTTCVKYLVLIISCHLNW